MDSGRFDRLAKTLSAGGTRRGPLHLLAALPLSGSLAPLLEQESAAGRRDRRKARHRHDPGKNTNNRTGKRNGKRTGPAA